MNLFPDDKTAESLKLADVRPRAASARSRSVAKRSASLRKNLLVAFTAAWKKPKHPSHIIPICIGLVSMEAAAGVLAPRAGAQVTPTVVGSRYSTIPTYDFANPLSAAASLQGTVLAGTYGIGSANVVGPAILSSFGSDITFVGSTTNASGAAVAQLDSLFTLAVAANPSTGVPTGTITNRTFTFGGTTTVGSGVMAFNIALPTTYSAVQVANYTVGAQTYAVYGLTWTNLAQSLGTSSYIPANTVFADAFVYGADIGSSSLFTFRGGALDEGIARRYQTGIVGATQYDVFTARRAAVAFTTLAAEPGVAPEPSSLMFVSMGVAITGVGFARRRRY